MKVCDPPVGFFLPFHLVNLSVLRKKTKNNKILAEWLALQMWTLPVNWDAELHSLYLPVSQQYRTQVLPSECLGKLRLEKTPKITESNC